MHTGEPKPPRFNRYHVYLIVAALVFSPVFALSHLRRACGHALYGWYPIHYCTQSQAWDWLLSTGGNVEVWIRPACVLAMFAAVIYTAFK